jgi:hypothetical protein
MEYGPDEIKKIRKVIAVGPTSILNPMYRKLKEN